MSTSHLSFLPATQPGRGAGDAALAVAAESVLPDALATAIRAAMRREAHAALVFTDASGTPVYWNSSFRDLAAEHWHGVGGEPLAVAAQLAFVADAVTAIGSGQRLPVWRETLHDAHGRAIGALLRVGAGAWPAEPFSAATAGGALAGWFDELQRALEQTAAWGRIALEYVDGGRVADCLRLAQLCAERAVALAASGRAPAHAPTRARRDA